MTQINKQTRKQKTIDDCRSITERTFNGIDFDFISTGIHEGKDGRSSFIDIQIDINEQINFIQAFADFHHNDAQITHIAPTFNPGNSPTIRANIRFTI